MSNALRLLTVFTIGALASCSSQPSPVPSQLPSKSADFEIVDDSGAIFAYDLAQAVAEARRSLAPEARLGSTDIFRVVVDSRTKVRVYYGIQSRFGGTYLVMESLRGRWKVTGRVLWNA